MSHVLGDQRPAKYAALLAQGETKMRAALLAGYSKHQARRAKEAIEKRPNVKRALERYAKRAEISAVRTLEQIRRRAFFDPRCLFDENGNLRPIHTLTQDEAAGIAQLDVVKRNAEPGDGHIDIIHKVKFVDSDKSLAMLAQHFHLVDETVKVDNDIRITVSWTKADEPDVIDVTPDKAIEE